MARRVLAARRPSSTPSCFPTMPTPMQVRCCASFRAAFLVVSLVPGVFSKDDKDELGVVAHESVRPDHVFIGAEYSPK